MLVLRHLETFFVCVCGVRIGLSSGLTTTICKNLRSGCDIVGRVIRDPIRCADASAAGLPECKFACPDGLQNNGRCIYCITTHAAGAGTTPPFKFQNQNSLTLFGFSKIIRHPSSSTERPVFSFVLFFGAKTVCNAFGLKKKSFSVSSALKGFTFCFTTS